jgi:hypothetical protein
MYVFHSKKNKKAQALVEFIMIGPIVIFGVLCFTYLLIYLDNQQRLESCLWYAIRSASFPEIYSPPATEEAQATIASLFQEPYSVQLEKTIEMNPLEIYIEQLAMHGTNLISKDPPFTKNLSLTLTYPNILEKLKFAFLGSSFQESEMTATTSGSVICSSLSGTE